MKQPQTEKSYKPNPKFSFEDLKDFSELITWLKQIARQCGIKNLVFISDCDRKDNVVRLRLFTKENEYYISARLPSKSNSAGGYLGCIVMTRKSRAGEEWKRGNDLTDGNYSENTWQRIKDDIIAYELVKVVRTSPDKE